MIAPGFGRDADQQVQPAGVLDEYNDDPAWAVADMPQRFPALGRTVMGEDVVSKTGVHLRGPFTLPSAPRGIRPERRPAG